MGVKGDKHTNYAELTAQRVLEKLRSIEGISAKKMFGGQGIFHDGKMFGIVDSKGGFALKVDDVLEKEYLDIGSIKHGKMPYYAVPDSMFNSDQLVQLAKQSIDVVKKQSISS